jgi:hypothetical protein
MRMFEDLPPHKPKDVEPLILLDKTPSIELPQEPQTTKSERPVQGSRPISWVSVEWDGNDWAKKQPKTQGHPIYLPSKPQGGTFMTYISGDCDQDERRYRAPMTKKIDTCIPTINRKGFHLYSSPMCANMTQALVATYSSSNCRPEKMTSLGRVTTEQLTGCADISDINSMAFWCDGVPESEMESPHPGRDLFIVIAFLFGVLLLFALVIGLLIFLRDRQDGERFWDVMTRRFGRRDGQIQL